jgi:hypothetical protein
VLLGLSATISHTAVVWAAALIGLYCSEACLQIASAVIVPGVAGCAASESVSRSPWYGPAAVLSIRHAERHWSEFSRFAHRAPYVSAALIVLGLYTRSLPPQIISLASRTNRASEWREQNPTTSQATLTHILKNRQFSLVEYQ